MKDSIEIRNNNTQFQRDIDQLKRMLQNFEETNEHLTKALAREKETKKYLDRNTQELDNYKHVVASQHQISRRDLGFISNLQTSIQPSEQLLLSYFPDSCILQLLKNSVGGDIPWVYKKDFNIYVAAIDSSPEDGLPSAMLSILVATLLNNIVLTSPALSPAQILNQLHELFWNQLKQDTTNENAGLSVAISLVQINTKTQEIVFSGAHSGLMLLSCLNNQMVELKGENCPIGGLHYQSNRKPYQNTNMDYAVNDTLYLTTNGLVKQLGGPKNGKFTKKRFVEFAKSKRHIRMQKFVSECSDYLDEWMSNCRQTDDILLIGIRF